MELELPPRLILFDGACNLCAGSVNFIIRNDPAGRFKFAPSQSPVGQEVLRRFGRPSQAGSVILVENGRVYDRSTAVLRIARGLRFPFPLGFAAILIPPVVRNMAYQVVARNRHRFGRREQCLVPTPDIRARFLDTTS